MRRCDYYYCCLFADGDVACRGVAFVVVCVDDVLAMSWIVVYVDNAVVGIGIVVDGGVVVGVDHAGNVAHFRCCRCGCRCRL